MPIRALADDKALYAFERYDATSTPNMKLETPLSYHRVATN